MDWSCLFQMLVVADAVMGPLRRVSDYLGTGDEVMGDRGFTVRDSLEDCGVNLIIPAFTRKGCQLTNEEVTRTRHIAHARIHVKEQWGAWRCTGFFLKLRQ